MKVVFLDYDGVVNTLWWGKKEGKYRFRFGTPSDGKVNNEQAVQWVSEFCALNGYSIVVSSTWRYSDNYADCLRNAGLRPEVKIVGRTPALPEMERGDEIGRYLEEHPEVTEYLIFDDDGDMGSHQKHLVKCNTYRGFGYDEFRQAEAIRRKLYEHPETRGRGLKRKNE